MEHAAAVIGCEPARIAVHLSLKELEDCSVYEAWVDVCKGWLVNE